jgi:GNAT superfamily N-acetyltransferase
VPGGSRHVPLRRDLVYFTAMIEIRLMAIADLPLGLKLSRQAGWNQMESDWRRFLSMQPQGCFVAELDGTPVATTVTCAFGPVAWIAMVLVEMGSRRKGVATSLLKHALDYLDNQHVRTVRLDATSAGQPVYERLGFLPEYSLTRYEGIAPGAGPEAHVETAPASLFPEIVAFDHRTTGAHREKMLVRLFEEWPQAVRVLRRGERLAGFVAARRGANATQIGPCIATDDAGPALLRDALSHVAGRPVFIDIPRDNACALGVAEAGGLKAQRHFVRMYRGDRITDRPAAIWASSGPEKG